MKITQAKTYLITGAASGIGAALATKLVALGNRVMLADINVEGARQVAAPLGDAGAVVELNIREAAAWERAFDATIERFGGLDVLINNAGIVRTGLARNVTIADHQMTIDTNFMGPLTGMIGALKRFRLAGSGHLVTVCSMTSFLPFAGLASYGASKHALRAFHHALALEERHSAIDFTIIHPTATDTPMLEQEAADDDAAMAFMAESVSADTVADTVIRAIRSKAIEVCMPQSQARMIKALGTNPQKLRTYADHMEALGQKGQSARRGAKST
jgi:NAD(P)-dependent dehydrogenase (short-subunit alcohol dehydrogenase family)